MPILTNSIPEIAPEKLTIMKIKAGDYGRDGLSEPTTPTSISPSSEFSSMAKSSRSSVTRRSTSRQASGSSRRSSSFLHSHRSKMSMELTSQAEGKFFALMDLMSTASREASSLKEVWSRITSERDALYREKEELLVRVDEVTEFLERKETEHHQHGHELSERKLQVEKLLLELSTALGTVADQKKRIADNEHRLQRARNELEEIGSTVSRAHTGHEKTKAELDSTILKLKAAEDDRDHAREDSHRHHTELKALLRDHADLKSKYTDTTTKLESARKEVLSFTDRLKTWEIERDESLHEKDRLLEDIKRARLSADDSSRALSELTERHDRTQRDATKLKETVRTIETERDDHAVLVENLRRDLKARTTARDEADALVASTTLKHDHTKRDLAAAKEKLHAATLEHTALTTALDHAHDSHRTLLLERDALKESSQSDRRKAADATRQLATTQDSLRRAEKSAADSASEIHALTHRNKLLVHEADDLRAAHALLDATVADLREGLALQRAETRTLTDSRDRVRAELASWRAQYEELSETVTEFRDEGGELEAEIENLRALLREAREQKERAVKARGVADKERDEYVGRYEDKCREVERLEESEGRWGGGGVSSRKSSFTRTVTGGLRTVSSGTTVVNGGGLSGGEGVGMGMLKVP